MACTPDDRARQTPNEAMDADRHNVFEALATTYWRAAHREICTMILFFSDVLDQGRKIENFLATDFPEAECENYTKMFELWLGGQRQGWEGFDTSPLYNETIRRAKGTQLLCFWKTRLKMLEHFLDTSVFYEPAMPVLPSIGQARPILEKFELPATDTTLRCTAIRGMRCIVCNSFIRTETYLECEKGCADCGPIPLNTRLIDDRGAHIKQELPSGLLSNPPVRLCLTCNLDDIDLKPCSRDHLQRRSSTAAESENKDVAKSKKHGSGLRGAVKRTVKDALLPNRAEQVFQRKLSDDEDKDFIRKREVGDSTKRFSYVMKAGAELERIVENSATFAALSSAMGAGGNAAAAIMSPSSGFNVIQSTIKSLRNRVTPAGTYHTSLRFGTITIESGVGKLRIAGQDFKANRGILVSPRFSPALLADKKDASVLLFAPSDRLELEKDNRVIVFGTCCNIYATQNQNGRYRRRRVRLTRRPIEERNGLACMKIVYGAAFSSYPDSRQSAEETTIETLVQEAVSYHKMLSRSKTTQSQHQALFEAAERVLESLQSALKSEVDKYLNRLVDVFLDPETDLSHNALSNNCQRLVDKLLQGKDFEYFFPRLPKQPISCDNPITNIAWPQYLMSFSDRIDGQSISLQQPNSVMTQYFSRTRFGGDVVDFMTSEVRAADGSGKYDALLLSPGSMKDRDSRTTAFNAMWEMPRDTLSILQFHLSREKPRYASGTGGVFTQGDWIENRLLLLLLVDIFGSLSGGLGASLFNLAASDSDLVKKIVLPKARVLGSARVGEKVRILQLPGKQIVYFIASKAEEQLKEIFQAPENDVALFSTMLHQCFHKVLRVYTKNVSQVVTKVLRRIMGKRPAKRGFTTVSRLYGTDFLSLAVHQAIQLYETRKRDGWFHLDFGDLIIVLQLFRKSKTVRENISTMERELVTGSQEDEQGV